MNRPYLCAFCNNEFFQGFELKVCTEHLDLLIERLEQSLRETREYKAKISQETSGENASGTREKADNG